MAAEPWHDAQYALKSFAPPLADYCPPAPSRAGVNATMKAAARIPYGFMRPSCRKSGTFAG